MGVWRRNPKVESQETRMVLGSDNHMDCANICCQLVCHFSVIWWAILEWKYSMTYDCFRKLRLLYGYKSMEGKRWKGVRNEAGVAEGQWIWWGWYFLQLYLLAVLLSRMTPLMICLCLNIMTLRITSSATTTPTWPWPAREGPSSQGSFTGFTLFILHFISRILNFCNKTSSQLINEICNTWVCSFLNYRYWNLLGTMMAGLCLPVDVLIFYKGYCFVNKTSF